MSVLSELRDGALILTINRPEAGNALNPAVGQGLLDALRDAATDPEVRTVIVTGAGEKIFSAGMDLKAFAAGEDMTVVGEGTAMLADCPKPVIAAVNGIAVAGGYEVVMRCDLVVAAEHARFGIPEVKRGLVAAGGGTRLPRRIPLQVALEMGLTGEPISAQRALELGLINRVVPSGTEVDEALALAEKVAANGPLAVRVVKKLVRNGATEGGAAAWPSTKELGAVFASEDAREGALAFVEKRPARFVGR